ncbi:MAG TPA: CsgG/HfaB family protein [Candidatus Onthomorpha intestinigallinarum]|uniref:CsgG/HfaB family protein n=1 Tax=Candidatus Onthomorpha intestinigallinarum TaxID=2840880 RepID=A0A9D1RGQ8_9BACT|nr:CsgG/HfaB family protein [Candidatus Onthomorpha intestinigallinarum]
MRRLYLLLLFCLLFPALGVQSQDKPKVAVYTTDESDYNIGAFVGDYLINAIVKRGEYIAIERTAQFLSEINKEQSFQRTGAVDDSQISRLGKNMGVQYVCVVKVARVGEQLFMSARLIDVETAEVKSTARPVSFNPDNLQDMESSCDNLVASMFGRV